MDDGQRHNKWKGTLIYICYYYASGKRWDAGCFSLLDGKQIDVKVCPLCKIRDLRLMTHIAMRIESNQSTLNPQNRCT